MLEKITVVDKIEALMDTGIIQVREAKRIMEDGVKISESFHRYTIAPGQDYSDKPAEVQAICAVTHTAEVIAAYEAAQSNNEAAA
jgi:hypothetical protein